ncbi:hypothetical protein [Streptomyces sp. NBC_00212]|uniref:hypothetical protein n=1 Tax=Streptomyces sp. NBC_00212 TaxID=2975684 RepID=UPI00324E54E0
MRVQKTARTALTAAAAALLPATTAAPAHADIPKKGDTFVISTVFEGKTVCVSAREEEGAVPDFPLVECDTNAAAQQWKRSANGRYFQNVASGLCLNDKPMQRRKKICELSTPGPAHWHQGVLGRVWTKSPESGTTFWAPFRHSTYGAILDFPGRSDGTIPQDAVPFHFGVVKQG